MRSAVTMRVLAVALVVALLLTAAVDAGSGRSGRHRHGGGRRGHRPEAGGERRGHRDGDDSRGDSEDADNSDCERDHHKTKDDYDAMMYLMHYGYLSQKNMNGDKPMSEKVMKDSVMKFQRMAHVPMTGTIDTKTMSMMNAPRCGMADYDADEPPMRRKRYALARSKWQKLDLTYRISTYTPHLPPPDVDREIAKALQFWGNVTALTFTSKLVGSVDLEIKFGTYNHRDAYPFDGPGGVLAHAFFPSEDADYKIAGDAHFDDSEVWTINSFNGQNLLYVAVHEFGHSLGLGHSEVRGAIMWPFARGYEPTLGLSMDDVTAIQMLYGRKEDRPTGTTTTSTTTTTTTPLPTTTTPLPSPTPDPTDPCSRMVDAMMLGVDGYTYMFIDRLVYRMNNEGTAPARGYPRRIYHVFPRAPRRVDAAFSYWAITQQGYQYQTVLFRGWYAYHYVRDEDGVIRLLSGYPRNIRDEWGLNTYNIDSAFVWSVDGSVYFTKGRYLWRHTTYAGMYPGYPMPISEHRVFRKLPRFQAAGQWTNRRTYFFSGDEYYRSWDPVDRANEGRFDGPWNTGRLWFSCYNRQ